MRTRLGRLLAWSRSRPRSCLMLVLLSGLALAGGSWAALTYYVDYHLRAAEQAANRYDFEAAQQHLAVCLRFHPGRARLHFEMARAARRAEHYEEAAEHLRKCKQLRPKDPDTALEALLLQAQRGDIAEVEKLLQQEVDRDNPDALLILEALAKGYAQIYRLDAAMYCLNRLLKQDPDNLVALLLRASLWKTAGNYTQADEDCRRAIEAYPQHRGARLQHGELLLLTKEADKALPQFEYLRQLAGDNDAEGLLGLARCHRQLGHMDTARLLLDKLLERLPHEGTALIERGKIALELESPAAAEKWFRQAVADYPFDAQSNYLLAQALRRQGREAEARDYEAVHTRLEADWKALQAAFQQVFKNPTAAEPRLQAGLICLRNGRTDEGERWLLSALEQAPEHAATRDALATHYEHTGRADLAELYGRPMNTLEERT